jgi:hypothetical protein
MAERRRFRFSEHALDRMLDAGLTVDEVVAAVEDGETLEEYEDGSRLMLGRAGIRPVHVVVADDDAEPVATVVTVYEPDPSRWDSTFRQRRAR